jgi:hypothetical protein
MLLQLLLLLVVFRSEAVQRLTATSVAVTSYYCSGHSCETTSSSSVVAAQYALQHQHMALQRTAAWSTPQF